jgi:hypothetical protein
MMMNIEYERIDQDKITKLQWLGWLLLGPADMNTRLMWLFGFGRVSSFQAPP